MVVRERARLALPSLTALESPLHTAAAEAARFLEIASFPDLAMASSAEQQASMEPPPVGLGAAVSGGGGARSALAAGAADSAGAALPVGVGSAVTAATAELEGRGTVWGSVSLPLQAAMVRTARDKANGARAEKGFMGGFCTWDFCKGLVIRVHLRERSFL